jgi:hypothetical protein
MSIGVRGCRAVAAAKAGYKRLNNSDAPNYGSASQHITAENKSLICLIARRHREKLKPAAKVVAESV